MFDPNLGRWMQEGPIGFEAGDSNLYRYEGNRAVNLTDPTGLKAKPPFPDKLGTIGEAIPNEEKGDDDHVMDFVSGGVGRKKWCELSKDNVIVPKMMPKDELPGFSKPGNNIGSGTHCFFGWPNAKGQFFGTGGCQGCVALIVRCKGGGGAIFHFSTLDNAVRTLGKYDWSGKECQAVVAGGDDERLSRALFDRVYMKARELFGPKNVSISNSSRIHIGNGGEWCLPPAK